MERAPNFLRGAEPEAPEPLAPADVPLDEMIDHEQDLLRVEYPDGSVTINLGGLRPQPSGESREHQANLAEHLDEGDMSAIAEDLLRKIEDDEEDQRPRLDDISKGLDMLGVKLEEPRGEPNEEGMSVVRHPVLLEAILRFQANARGELLPADGPVKVRDDGAGTAEEGDDANALAKDFNHYLTNVATEYYPDMDRMLFSLGFGGEAYKKVYRCPIRNRPVAQTVDRKDIILSKGAVSIEANPRVTHRSEMSPSQVRRMMLAGAWRDVDLSVSSLGEREPVDDKLSLLSGVEPKTSILPEEHDRTIYECYCELDLPGYEHKEKGKVTGLQLPYRVTIDKDSREVLEIRRWWREDDDQYLRKEVFVEYVFVPAFPGLNLGLLHILGNATRALTAAWRIALDNGMLANFPGGVSAREAGRQQTANIRVAPGQVAAVDTNGMPLRDAFMPLPYRDVTAGFMAVINEITQTAQRVGGTADTATGEGRQDAPVGTTIALIEQATKVLSAVHKRMHQAQAKEFALLKELFRDDPEALVRGNRTPALGSPERISRALEDADLVPASDPNTASQMLRVQKAIAIKTLATQNPMLYDPVAVDRRILQMVGVGDIDDLFTKVPPQPMGEQMDPANMVKAQAAMLAAQAKLADVEMKAKTSEQDAQMRLIEQQVKSQDAKTRLIDSISDNRNRAADREAKLEMERLKTQREMIDSHAKMQLEQQKAAAGIQQTEQKTLFEREKHYASLQAQREKSDFERQRHVDGLGLEREKMKASTPAKPKPKGSK